MKYKNYREMYDFSIRDPEAFWGKQAEDCITWFKPWDHVIAKNPDGVSARWFVGGKLNACYNCLDRHLPQLAEKIAIIWEGDEDQASKKMTYQELFIEVCRFANLLKEKGIRKGDRVCIYMPMLIESIVAVLACARIGAIHSVVFGGFSAEALRNRINDAECKMVITADGGYRGGKLLSLKLQVDEALEGCSGVQQVIVVKHTGLPISWNASRDIDYHEAVLNCSSFCNVEELEANEPLFILYTSGSTGKPKGILHTLGGYLLQVSLSFKVVFNYEPNDIFWCTADIGWITGHSYVIYGPLMNGATTVLFAGTPTHPSPSRYWEIIDKYKVNIFYTAPTAIRSLMRFGQAPLQTTHRTSLKLLATVGEPINPDVWEWYYQCVGKLQCPIVDTWWQTETGGIMITPFPKEAKLKPGAAGWPFFGIHPEILDESGKVIEGEGEGNLVIAQPWPGQLHTIYGNPERFQESYFRRFPGYYFTGDGARRDQEGDYWITGRVDDVLNVSGHRLGTAEIESALVSHPKVAEAAVVDYPHSIKGQGIYAFVTLMENIFPDEALKKELLLHVKERIGSIAVPDYIQWSNELPKTRSGKIMRRLLRKIVHGETQALGDTSTLANPLVIEDLIKNSFVNKLDNPAQ